jgi:hypothetical protein
VWLERGEEEGVLFLSSLPFSNLEWVGRCTHIQTQGHQRGKRGLGEKHKSGACHFRMRFRKRTTHPCVCVCVRGRQI